MSNPFKDRVREAMKIAWNICKQAKSGGANISEEDMLVLLKYENLGIIKMTLPKFKLAEVLYYPTIQHKAFKNLSQNFWVDVMLWATKAHNIKCNVGLNSVAAYRSSPHRYNFIEPVVVPVSDIGKLGRDEEIELFNLLKEEF